jgi:hypothetical protein
MTGASCNWINCQIAVGEDSLVWPSAAAQCQSSAVGCYLDFFKDLELYRTSIEFVEPMHKRLALKFWLIRILEAIP